MRSVDIRCCSGVSGGLGSAMDRRPSVEGQNHSVVDLWNAVEDLHGVRRESHARLPSDPKVNFRELLQLPLLTETKVCLFLKP